MSFNFPNSPAPGTIHQPVGGPQYIFSGGAWIQLPTTSTTPLTGATFFNSRTSAMGSIIPADVLSVTLHGYTTPGDFGGAQYKKVVSEPTHQGKFQSADGAWWEIAEPILTPQMFGAAGDGVTDDYQAIVDAIESKLTIIVAAWYHSGPTIHFPDAVYKVGSTIELKRSVKLTGNSSGMPNDSRSTLLFADDTMGIVVNRYNTLDGGVEAVPTTAADASIIEGLRLIGGGTDQTKHGIWLRARATIRNCYIDNFPGNGINIVADVASGGPSFMGNANVFYLENLRIVNCGMSGVYAQGGDANAGMGMLIDCTSNGRWGIWDSSFLGNTWIACHTANNGTSLTANNAADQSSHVHEAGMRYGANTLATEAELAANAPSAGALCSAVGATTLPIWVPLVAAGVHPQVPTWTAGKPVGTYFHGGAYRSSGVGAASMFLGCYTESGQSGCAFRGLAAALGGPIFGAGFVNGGSVFGRAGNKMISRGNDGGFEVDGTDLLAAFAARSDNSEILQWRHVDETPANIWRFHRANGDYVFDNQNSALKSPMKFTSELTAEQMGTGAPVPWLTNIVTLALGTGLAMRRVTTGATAPTTGVHARGEIVFNYNPTAGGKIGWVCTATGTPGTWNTWGVIDP